MLVKNYLLKTLWNYKYFSFFIQIQIIGYNSDLYSSYEEAASKANGLVGLAIFLKVSALRFFNDFILFL